MTNHKHSQSCMQSELDQSDHAVLRLLPHHPLLCSLSMLHSRTYVHHRGPTASSMPPMLHATPCYPQLQSCNITSRATTFNWCNIVPHHAYKCTVTQGCAPSKRSSAPAAGVCQQKWLTSWPNACSDFKCTGHSDLCCSSVFHDAQRNLFVCLPAFEFYIWKTCYMTQSAHAAED